MPKWPCSEERIISTLVTYYELETSFGTCNGYFYKKCLKQQNKLKTRPHFEKVSFTKLETDCCSGYTSFDGKCIPVCIAGCLNGVCSAPNKCTCFDGYEEDMFNRSAKFYIKNFYLYLKRIHFNDV